MEKKHVKFCQRWIDHNSYKNGGSLCYKGI